jgi:serine/threonine protein kinase/tetratricopeptide (TPR) repeat protein
VRVLTYGPWQVECTLGVGGMGVVHRVRHVASGSVAALKTAASAGAPARRALRREAAALRQLDHPAIVRLLEDGTSEAEPWYTMELLDGRSLSAVLGAPVPHSAPTWTNPTLASLMEGSLEAEGPLDPLDPLEPVEPAPRAEPPGLDLRRVRYGLGRLAELCHALCHLHAAGLVHCDLKPDNVLVVGHRAVLLDFGLVATRGPRTDRTSILQDARIAGTASYMSPERAGGAPFDARADLYAVGCMIYKVVTGRPPFVGGPVQVMEAHRHSVPAPLEELVPGVPAELDQLVRKLLSKDPRQRPGHAQRVLHVLAQMGVEVPSWPLPASAPLYQPLLRGRQGPLAALQEAVAHLWGQKPTGSALWLSGESGSGKSRLVGQLVTELAGRAPAILVGGCSALQTARGPTAAGVPLEVFHEPLREIAESASRAPELAALAAGPLAVLRPWLPPGLAGTPGPSAPAPPDTAAAARHRLYAAVCDLLEAWFAHKPALLVLDDLQWADELSVGALQLLLHRLPGRPWLVLGLMRSESDDAHLSRVLQHGQRLRLSRLGEEDVRAIVCDMLGQREAPEPLLAWVERHASGNPLFVGECLRAAVADGVLALQDGQWAFQADPAQPLAQRPGPASLEELVAARLEPLSPLALEVVRAAAVIGKVAALPLLGALTGRSALQIEGAVDELARRAIAEIQGESAVFVHDLLVERVYAAMSEEERARLHRRAADALPPEEASALAWHRERAGQLQAAATAYAQAAHQATSRLQLREAEHRFQDALRLCAPEQRLALRASLVRLVLLPMGRAAEAEQELLALLQDMPPEDSLDKLEVLSDLGRALGRGSRPSAALDAFAEAQRMAERLGDTERATLASSEAGTVLVRLGRSSEAAALQEGALDRLGPQADPVLLAVVQHRLAGAYNMLGRNEEALALLDQLVETYEGMDQPSALAHAHSTRANVLSFLGRYDESIADYQAALALQRRIGNRQSQGALLGNWASALVQLHRLPEAVAQYREALAIHREVGDQRYEGIVLRALASFRLLEADLEGVLEGAEEAERALQPLGDPLWIAHCHNLRAKAYRYLGRPDEARHHLQLSMDTYRRIGAVVELGEVLVFALSHGIAFGEPFEEVMAELQAISAQASPDSRLGASRALAEHTLAMYHAGKELLAGEDPERLPLVLQARIRQWSDQRA